MDQKNKSEEILPTIDPPPNIRFGNVKGNHFYNALKHKRVNGKIKVVGEFKSKFQEVNLLPFSPNPRDKKKTRYRSLVHS